MCPTVPEMNAEAEMPSSFLIFIKPLLISQLGCN